jgi:preprotein translocase subunit SecA
MSKSKTIADFKHNRELKPYIKMVKKINALEPQFEAYTDEQLKHKTIEFRERLSNGETIHDITAEAFATVREASKRVLGLRHFDVQLLGGLVLVKGNIAEMRTGEGKTLVASLPGYLYALEEKGAHIITVNDYLAKRDKELIGQIHEFLGLTVGLNIAGMSSLEKQEAYNCDITYGVGTEFGFDYLRDNMVYALEQKVQRPYHFAIVDEVDSILIDEARTPLIIAGKDQPSGRLYKVCANVVKTLKEEDDYLLDIELKAVNLTDKGVQKCEKVFGIQNLFDLEHSELFHALLQALRARTLYKRDVDYIVEDGEIKLVDMNTGRIMEGRSLSDGLHQAIESKEGLTNTEENKTFASITIQNYYRMYPHLAGMTGTAKTEENELRKVYGMDVIQIPTNKENLREDLPDLVFMTKDQKYNHLLEEVTRRHESGQPILIGTSSIVQSEEIAEVLDKAKLPYQLLNAKSAEKEAQLIALAGQKGEITVATNMAGRGTDIMLGEGVAELGGLHVIGTERNESKRIDNQLKGRSARQGDPGSTQFIISLEDYLFVRFAPDELERVKPKVKADKNGLITTNNVHKFVETAQKISEGVHYSIREHNLKLEDVINKQREVIYNFRNTLFETDNILSFIEKQTKELPTEIISNYFGEHGIPEEMDLKPLTQELNRILLSAVSLEDNKFETVEEIMAYMEPLVDEHYTRLQELKDDESVQATAKAISLSVIDNLWTSHLDTMQQLKEGIGIRQYQQEDPVQIFEKEGYALFESLFNQIKYEISARISYSVTQIMESRNEL